MTPLVLVLAGMDLKVRRSATVVVGRSVDLFTHPPPSYVVIRYQEIHHTLYFIIMSKFYQFNSGSVAII